MGGEGSWHEVAGWANGESTHALDVDLCGYSGEYARVGVERPAYSSARSLRIFGPALTAISGAEGFLYPPWASNP